MLKQSGLAIRKGLTMRNDSVLTNFCLIASSDCILLQTPVVSIRVLLGSCSLFHHDVQRAEEERGGSQDVIAHEGKGYFSSSEQGEQEGSEVKCKALASICFKDRIRIEIINSF